MLTFPLGDGAALIVLEPGNIQRLKEGRPLKVGTSLVCFTPNMQAFMNALGLNLDADAAEPNKRVERGGLRISPEELDAALKLCQKLPEVLR